MYGMDAKKFCSTAFSSDLMGQLLVLCFIWIYFFCYLFFVIYLFFIFYLVYFFAVSWPFTCLATSLGKEKVPVQSILLEQQDGCFECQHQKSKTTQTAETADLAQNFPSMFHSQCRSSSLVEKAQPYQVKRTLKRRGKCWFRNQQSPLS